MANKNQKRHLRGAPASKGGEFARDPRADADRKPLGEVALGDKVSDMVSDYEGLLVSTEDDCVTVAVDEDYKSKEFLEVSQLPNGKIYVNRLRRKGTLLEGVGQSLGDEAEASEYIDCFCEEQSEMMERQDHLHDVVTGVSNEFANVDIEGPSGDVQLRAENGDHMSFTAREDGSFSVHTLARSGNVSHGTTSVAANDRELQKAVKEFCEKH